MVLTACLSLSHVRWMRSATVHFDQHASEDVVQVLHAVQGETKRWMREQEASTVSCHGLV